MDSLAFECKAGSATKNQEHQFESNANFLQLEPSWKLRFQLSVGLQLPYHVKVQDRIAFRTLKSPA